MANIGTMLRQEISRLARREIHGQVQAVKKASAQYRRHIAALKRQVATLERQVAAFLRRTLDMPSAATKTPTQSKARFVSKGLRAQRGRLELSAADYGRLAGVSAQSIYNWSGSTPSRGPSSWRLSLRFARSVSEKLAPA